MRDPPDGHVRLLPPFHRVSRQHAYRGRHVRGHGQGNPARDLDRVHRLLVGVTRIGELGGQRISGLLSQPKGSHADEYETSLLLAIAPDVVRLDKLASEIPDRPDSRGVFVPAAYHREPGPGYSATGVYGDATLGTKQKGEAIVEAVVEDLVGSAFLGGEPVLLNEVMPAIRQVVPR